jgi:hypothetical protein
MAVSVHSSRATAKLLQQKHLPILRQAAKKISAALPSNFV